MNFQSNGELYCIERSDAMMKTMILDQLLRRVKVSIEKSNYSIFALLQFESKLPHEENKIGLSDNIASNFARRNG